MKKNDEIEREGENEMRQCVFNIIATILLLWIIIAAILLLHHQTQTHTHTHTL